MQSLQRSAQWVILEHLLTFTPTAAGRPIPSFPSLFGRIRLLFHCLLELRTPCFDCFDFFERSHR